MSSSSRMTSISTFSVVWTFLGPVRNMLAKYPGTPASSRNRSSIRVVLLSDMNLPSFFWWTGAPRHRRFALSACSHAFGAWFWFRSGRTRSGIEHCELLRRLGDDAEGAQLVDHGRVDIGIVAVCVDHEAFLLDLAFDQHPRFDVAGAGGGQRRGEHSFRNPVPVRGSAL